MGELAPDGFGHAGEGVGFRFLQPGVRFGWPNHLQMRLAQQPVLLRQMIRVVPKWTLPHPGRYRTVAMGADVRNTAQWDIRPCGQYRQGVRGTLGPRADKTGPLTKFVNQRTVTRMKLEQAEAIVRDMVHGEGTTTQRYTFGLMLRALAVVVWRIRLEQKSILLNDRDAA